MLLTITNAGLAKETNAMSTGIMPKFDTLVVGDGTPNPNPLLATALVSQKLSIPVLIVETLSGGTVKLRANIDTATAVNIKEIGIKLDDGTLYAYAQYGDGNGFNKALGFSFDLYVLLSRENLPAMQFTYSPLDIPAITQDIFSKATIEVNALISEHAAAADPHPQYLTKTEADNITLDGGTF